MIGQISALLAFASVAMGGYIQAPAYYAQPPTVVKQPLYQPVYQHFHQPSFVLKQSLPAYQYQPTIAKQPLPFFQAETKKLVLPEPQRVNPNPNYSYSYAVKDATTGDEKSHQESRNGNNVVGKYSLVEPDGTLRTVTYTAGDEGFNAIVERTPGYAPPNPILVKQPLLPVKQVVAKPLVLKPFTRPVPANPSYDYGSGYY